MKISHKNRDVGQKKFGHDLRFSFFLTSNTTSQVFYIETNLFYFRCFPAILTQILLLTAHVPSLTGDQKTSAGGNMFLKGTKSNKCLYNVVWLFKESRMSWTLRTSGVRDAFILILFMLLILKEPEDRNERVVNTVCGSCIWGSSKGLWKFIYSEWTHHITLFHIQVSPIFQDQKNDFQVCRP